MDGKETARRHLMGLGRGVEVLSPEPLRPGFIDFTHQIARLDGGENDPETRDKPA